MLRAAWDTPERRLQILLFLSVLVVVGPFVQEYNAQSAARYTLTAALWDQHSIILDDYEAALGIDKVDDGVHLRSDKAPGQPFLAVPFYALARAVGAEPATRLRVEGNLGVWWVTLWSALIPTAALTVLMYRHARRWFPDTAGLAALAMTYSTLLLPYASELHAHNLAALAVFASWHLLTRARASRPMAWLAGLLAGFAIAVEYPAALAALAIGAWLLVKRQFTSAVSYAVAAVPALAAMLVYQTRAFGSPLTTSYTEKAASPEAHQLPSDWIPDPVHLVQILLGAKGLLFTPLILVALWTAGRLARSEPGDLRDQARLSLLVFLLFLGLQSAWVNPWGGGGAGPRYLITAYPFLVVAVAAAWRERPLGFYIGVGTVSMGLALVASTLLEGRPLILGHLVILYEEGPVPTIFTMALGPTGWLVHLGLGLLVLRSTISAAQSLRPARMPDPGATHVSPPEGT